MPNNFTSTLNKIAQKLSSGTQINNKSESDLLNNAVKLWCEELDFDHKKISYIYQRPEIIDLISCLLKEKRQHDSTENSLFQKINNLLNFFRENPLSQKINNLLSQINLNFRTTNMEFIVLIAFVITAVGYCVYLINHSPKQQQLTQKTNNTSSETSPQISDPISTTPPSPEKLPQPSPKLLAPTSNTPPSSEQSYLLVLVVSASNKSLIDSLRTGEKIDKENSEKLYDATQYLRQDTEDKLSQKLANLNQYQATEASEYDIYLITIELNKADEGFKPNVNQLDRYDAFSNLSKVKEISPRLQIEAYENLDVYSR